MFQYLHRLWVSRLQFPIFRSRNPRSIDDVYAEWRDKAEAERSKKINK